MFKRIATNKRVQQAFAALVAAVIGASINLGDAQINQIVEVISYAISGILGLASIRGAVTDAAAKRETPVQPKSIERSTLPSDFKRGVPVVAMLLMGTGILLSNVACSSWDPAGQTAKAMNQRSKFLWDANNSFATDIDGTQTGEFEMFQGGDIIRKDDGSIDWEQSESAYYLHYKPKADAVAMAFGQAYAQSTIQQERQLQAIERLTGLVTGIVGARMGITVGADGSYVPPVQQPAQEDKLDRLLGILEDRLPATAKKK